MAEPALLEPSGFDSLSQIELPNSVFFDPHLFPDDFNIPHGLSGDLDLDGADFDLDLDFPIEDLFQTPSEGNDFLLSSDGQPGFPHSDDTSAVSSSTPISGNPSSDSCGNIGPASPESGHSESYARETGNLSPSSGVTDQEVKRDRSGLKRKKEDGSANRNRNPNPNPSRGKFGRLEEGNSTCVLSAGSEDEKKKARLMRNRESAQLSRQRKKHHVEELEDKVKAMQATIADLNSKISYIAAENAGLRQQLAGSRGSCPPPPAAYPAPMGPVHLPWVPGYAYRPQGSQVPLVPIPRMKPQAPAPAPKARSKAKKVVSVSFLGLLVFVLIFGGMTPAVNLIYGVNKDVTKVGCLSPLTVGGHGNGLNITDSNSVSSGKLGFRRDGIDRIGDTGRVRSRVKDKERRAPPSPSTDVPVFTHNSSESLPALLYVPRNGKHVKINGNLIIHSVLASEKAMAEKTSRDEAKPSSGKETSLAIAGNMASALAVSQARKEVERHSKSYRSSASDTYRDAVKTAPADGPLQQWFREELAGPILSSGMCTEVFQFEVSRPLADPNGIVPATPIVNASDGIPSPRSAHPVKTGNRRILYPEPIPISDSTVNDTDHIGRPSGSSSNASVPSMVVSVLADPREVGDGDGDGMMSQKSLSRIFVVVLLDSVKYVTYSCVLPFKSSAAAAAHLVN